MGFLACWGLRSLFFLPDGLTMEGPGLCFGFHQTAPHRPMSRSFPVQHPIWVCELVSLIDLPSPDTA